MVEIVDNDRIVGGLTPEATKRARDVYASFCLGQIHTTDARTAELSKLAENSFRDVNIAFANELSVICDGLGIDVWELISLANRHPRVEILQPGPGVGGHCIAVDPWFVVEAAPEASDLIRTARRVNDAKPAWVTKKIKAVVDASPQSSVSLFGLAFKPNIDDLRESPAVEIAFELASQLPNTTIRLVEPHVAALPEGLQKLDNVELVSIEEALDSSDVVALLVDHNIFLEIEPARLDGKTVIDTRGKWSSCSS